MAATEHTHGGYRLYWVTWLWLLILTIFMLGFEVLRMPRFFMVLALIVFMLVKAAFIAGNFMHLRFERLNLIVTVAVGLLITGAVLFVLIYPDGLRVLQLSRTS
ncbi:MAG: cytochrome C oxidase subunit IV family protein [Acidobacteria bacterium]|nr:cytochrome C oxidase subunit IV family protein [Acidobacteriota bacterium]MDW7983859.1 cytochrome C oxidase subunit IV family protein [Acidobacteriota bacterium]